MTETATPHGPPPLRAVHHTAFRCFDAEETREFYEDVLGLELAAALAIDQRPGTETAFRYMHLFFRMRDGNFVAFFDTPADRKPDFYKGTDSFDLHLAFKVESEEEMLAHKARLEAKGLAVRGPIDHHFVRSIYFTDPNGIRLEVTTPTPRHDAILAEEQAQAREAIRRWSAETAALRAARHPAGTA